MKISTRGRYGMRVLIDLAERAGEKHVTLASIAERQHISLRYLEQVVVILKRGGFVRSVKGAAGGYTLSRPANRIIVGDALRRLEGDMLIIDELAPGETENKLRACLRAVVYAPLNERIARVIDNLTLESLLGTSDEGEPMYFI
jgi:Rrf2 family protein